MLRRTLLFLLLPLALGCQKHATAQSPHAGYQALMERFREWPREQGIAGMVFQNHHDEAPLDAFLVHDVLHLPVKEGYIYKPGQYVRAKGYTAFFLCRSDSLREGCRDYLLCTFTPQGRSIDQYVCARERYEFTDGENVTVRLPEMARNTGDTLSFYVKEYTQTGYNMDLEQGNYLCRRTKIQVDPQGRIIHRTPETFPACSYRQGGPDREERFIDDLPFASNTDFLREIYGIVGHHRLGNSFWLARHTSMQLRERLRTRTPIDSEGHAREYDWEPLAGILPGEDTYWTAELNDIHSYQGARDKFLVSLRSRKMNRNSRPDIVTVLRVDLDYNNGSPIITDVDWTEDHRAERRARVVDFLRELYSPLKQDAAGRRWKFQDEDFVQKHSTQKWWEKLTSPPKGVKRWWAFDDERERRITVKDERMLLDIEPQEPYTYSVKYIDGGDMYVTLVKADVIDGRVMINDMSRDVLRPVSFEVAFAPGGKMLGRIVEREKGGYKLRYVKNVFPVAADTVTTEVRSAYNGQGRLYPEESDTVQFHERPTMDGPVTTTVIFAKDAKAYTDCLGFEKGWFKTFAAGKECYVRADKVHWMYYYNTQEKARMAQERAAQPAPEPASSESTWIDYVEENTSFPGGDEACMAFLRQNARMPDQIETFGLSARVIVSFVVNVDGTLSEARVVRYNIKEKEGSKAKTLSQEDHDTLYEQTEMALEAEALRLIALMPQWKPATYNGQPVKSRYNLPLLFNPETK